MMSLCMQLAEREVGISEAVREVVAMEAVLVAEATEAEAMEVVKEVALGKSTVDQ